MEQTKYDRYYTYADYLSWDERERVELIDGEAVMQSAPSRVHQGVLGELYVQLRNYLKDKPCKVYPAPFSVHLESDRGKDTVLEPDIVVVCDKAKLNDRGCVGAPDMVIEILSPTTAQYDKVVKFNKYLKAGVKEYWMVDTESKTVSVNTLDNNRYVAAAYADTDAAPVGIFQDFSINLSEVFAEVE